MPKIRKISHDPPEGCRHGFLVDANFMAMKYIPEKYAPNDREKERITSCKEWWAAIDNLVDARKATVYIPDVCIAEAFKVLAKNILRTGGFLLLKYWVSNAKSYQVMCHCYQRS